MESLFLAIPSAYDPEFDDRFLGKTTVDCTGMKGRFVVWKSADAPAYQLAVVVDDALGA